jgi:hypothetical protein
MKFHQTACMRQDNEPSAAAPDAAFQAEEFCVHWRFGGLIHGLFLRLASQVKYHARPRQKVGKPQFALSAHCGRGARGPNKSLDGTSVQGGLGQ